MALTADGKVFSWGDGELGQLGHGDNQYVCGSPGNSLCEGSVCIIFYYWTMDLQPIRYCCFSVVY